MANLTIRFACPLFTVYVEFAAGLILLQFSGDLRCGCVPRKYCSTVEQHGQQQQLVARGLRDSCIGLQACDVLGRISPFNGVLKLGCPRS